VTTLKNIGLIYDNLEEHDKSLANLEEALKIYRELLPINHPNIAMTLINIGIIYSHKFDYEKALKHFEEALKCLEPNNSRLFIKVKEELKLHLILIKLHICKDFNLETKKC
jgi:tetratricopeptide (TPR) repeat protein